MDATMSDDMLMALPMTMPRGQSEISRGRMNQERNQESGSRSQ